MGLFICYLGTLCIKPRLAFRNQMLRHYLEMHFNELEVGAFEEGSQEMVEVDKTILEEHVVFMLVVIIMVMVKVKVIVVLVEEIIIIGLDVKSGFVVELVVVIKAMKKLYHCCV
jgi:hypothetical protein